MNDTVKSKIKGWNFHLH